MGNFFSAIFNVFIFLPYFFSVPTLFKTLFAPWKNTTAPVKKNPSFSDSLNQWSFNMISRAMGFLMRSSLLIFYLIVQASFMLILPLIILLYIISYPFINLKKSFAVKEEVKKEALKKQFLSTHVLSQENMTRAQDWFELWYKQHVRKNNWWELTNLFALPPLARDWATGYTPTLDEYTEDLTSPAYQSTRTHLVGRQKELVEIERVLSKSAEANIIIAGEQGIGKNTIVEALAKRIYEGQVSVLLMYKRVLKLNLEKILSTNTDTEKREELLEELFEEALHAKNIILVIDNIDKYVSTAEGRIDLSSSLEKYAKAADLHFVGITTPFAYEKYIAQNSLIQQLFTKIDVYEISKKEAYEILYEAALLFESRHNLIIPFETIAEAIEKSEFFITAVPFPEKALQLLDEACVLAGEQKQKRVLPEHIDKVLNDKTHIPVSLTQDLKIKLLTLETILRQDIVQQEEAVKEVASGLRRAFLLMGKRSKPLASFLFLGPTGVGKTETAKAIAHALFDSETTMIRFDMSNFQAKEDIPKLIGSDSLKTPGLLTAALRERPFGVLLLDELEKANKELLNIFFTILDEGYFTDGYGKRVDCKNLIIIATSNAGAEFLYEISRTAPEKKITQNEVIDFLIKKGIYTPEFLNRFDAIVVYSALTEQSSTEIARMMLRQALDQVFSLYKVRVNVSDTTLQNIVKQTYNPEFGARTMERALRTYLEDSIAKKILSGEAKEGDTINL